MCNYTLKYTLCCIFFISVLFSTDLIFVSYNTFKNCSHREQYLISWKKISTRCALSWKTLSLSCARQENMRAYKPLWRMPRAVREKASSHCPTLLVQARMNHTHLSALHMSHLRSLPARFLSSPETRSFFL